MYHPKLEKEIRCPLEYGLAVFGGKWKARILCVLSEKQVLRYSALRAQMTDIADPVRLSAILANQLSANSIIRLPAGFANRICAKFANDERYSSR